MITFVLQLKMQVMRSKLLISVFIGAMAMISCSGDEGTSGSNEQGTANTVANLYVEGMM
jgi:hypothetical protein